MSTFTFRVIKYFIKWILIFTLIPVATIFTLMIIGAFGIGRAISETIY